MIDIKSENEIGKMAKGGKILADVLGALLQHIKPGVSELEIDTIAEEFIRSKGAEPAFKRVRGYNHAICVSTNEVVVHGVPTNYLFQEGDVVGIDCGVYFEGFNTDMAETLKVKSQKSKVKTQNHVRLGQNEKYDVDRFLETGRRALEEAIQVAKIGNRIGHISKTIQNIVEGAGYSVVRSLIGHGIGKKLHEEPEVPGFLVGPIEKTAELYEGMTIAIEVIYNMGKSDVVYANEDGWTIKTKDNSLSGVFERTIAITREGPLVLTK